MDHSTNSGHLVDASVAFVAVVLFQAAYCGLKFGGALLVLDRSQLRMLVWMSCGLGLTGLLFSLLFLVMRKHDNDSMSFVMLTIWKVSSELSICCVEGFEVLYHMRYAWPTPQKRPLSFWSYLAVQSIVVGLGAWQLAERRFAVLWALPIVLHVQFLVTTVDAIVYKVDLYTLPSWVPWIWVTSGVCASAMAFGINWAPHQTALQCLACMLVVSNKGICDWLKVDDDLDRPWFERFDCHNSEINNDPELECQATESLKPSVSQSSSSDVRLAASATLSQSIPAPSDAEQSATSDVALDNGIICVQTIEQITENIPNGLFEMPSNNEAWVRCFLTVADLTVYRQTIEKLPTAHVVGKTWDTHYYEVAMTGSCLQWLFDHDVPFLLASESGLSYDLTEPSEGEVHVFGVMPAREMAARRFMLNAMEATSSARHGHGLDRYYLRNTSDKSVLATFMWTFLLRDISLSSAAVRRRFLQHCVFISLHALEDAESSSTLEVLERGEKTWINSIRDLCLDRIRWPLGNPKEEMHLALLLRGLFESAEETDWFLHCHEFDTRYSAKDNIKKLGCLMDCDDDPHSVPFGGLNQDRVRWMLSRCTMFNGAGELDVTKLTEQIRNYVPVDFQDMERLPASLVHTIRHETANVIRIEMRVTDGRRPMLMR